MSEESDKRLVDRVLSTFAQLVDARRTVEPMWKEITNYIYPQRSGWEFQDDAALTSGDYIFDGTAIEAHAKLADGLFGWLVSPSLDWLMFEPDDRRFRDNQKAMSYAQELERYLYDVFNRSNYYETMAQDIRDCSALGTSVIYGEEAKELGAPVFTPLHLREVYLSENRYGEVDTLYRDFQVTNRVLLEMFPKMDRELAKLAHENPEAKARILHAQFPRMQGKVVDELKTAFRSNKAYASIYLYQGAAGTGRSQASAQQLSDVTKRMSAQKPSMMILENGGTDTRKFDAWRFAKASGQVYGYCPGFESIWDVKMLNIEAKTIADQAEMAARPPMQAPESMKGRLRLYSGGVSYGNGEVKPVITNFSSPLIYDEINRRVQTIRNHFKTDYFQSISSIQGGSRERTRSEIMEMKAESAAVLGTVLNRIQSERIETSVRMTIAIEAAAGRLPRPPEGLPADLSLRLVIRGPLAQSQRKYLRIDGITKGISAAFQLQAVDPDIVNQFKVKDAARELALANGYPVDFLNTKEDADRLDRQAAEQRAAAQRFQMENERLQASAAGGKAPEPGSPVQKMMGGK